MKQDLYCGHPTQIRGVEEFRRQGGKGDGMRFYRVRNGNGLECMISLDRAADPAEVCVNGKNIGFLAPCGYVSPAYRQLHGLDFLKTFNAGFMTTCGLNAAGSPCTDDGEDLCLHGSISNTPADQASYAEEADGIRVRATVRDGWLFGRNMRLDREFFFPYDANEIRITDTVTNEADVEAPFEILYHCNMGYPLLDEDAVLTIPSTAVAPRNPRSAEGIDQWNIIERPQAGFVEQCYYHTFPEIGVAKVFQPKGNFGITLTFDPKELPFFTEWKMMGEKQYVLGLEPGNCLPDGRAEQRKNGTLAFLKPGEQSVKHLKFIFE